MDAVPIIDIPATALTKFNQQPAVWIVDPSSRTVSIRNVDVLRFDQAQVVVSQGLDTGEVVVTAGVQALHPGPEGSPARIGAMTGFNLSEWALKHRSLVVYLMIVAVIAGVPVPISGSAAAKIPPSSSRPWSFRPPGPAQRVDETLKQVTERLERKLQETPHLDFLRSFTRAGVTTIFVNLKGSATAKEVSDTWYQVRKNVGDIRHTLPAGVVGPGFNDDFGDTFGIIYGFTRRRLHPPRTARPRRGDPLQAASRARRLEDRTSGRAGRADLRRVLDEGARQPGHRPRRR